MLPTKPCFDDYPDQLCQCAEDAASDECSHLKDGGCWRDCPVGGGVDILKHMDHYLAHTKKSQ